MVAATHIYKNYKIEKIVKHSNDVKRGYYIEYYTINGAGYYLYLKDAKSAIDKGDFNA